MSIVLILSVIKFIKYKINIRKYRINPIVNPKDVKLEMMNLKRPKDYLIEFLDN